MRVPIFQVDAFATRRFTGNPAAVMVMDSFPDDAMLQAVAAENNLAETAFLVRDGEDYRLRWFTPLVEVPLCGHATLASAAAIMERLDPDRREVLFHTASGPLRVWRTETGYCMSLPARASDPIPAPEGLAEALGAAPRQVFTNAFNHMAVMDDAATIRALAPDMAALARLDRPGIIATAPGAGSHDFVSRYFAPAKGITEDPVTGGTHCMLVPYWADRLGRAELRACQASSRGGELLCRLAGDRVEIEGACIFYLEGTAEI